MHLWRKNGEWFTGGFLYANRIPRYLFYGKEKLLISAHCQFVQTCKSWPKSSWIYSAIYSTAQRKTRDFWLFDKISISIWISSVWNKKETYFCPSPLHTCGQLFHCWLYSWWKYKCISVFTFKLLCISFLWLFHFQWGPKWKRDERMEENKTHFGKVGTFPFICSCVHCVSIWQ